MSILTFHSEALCLIPEQMQPKEQAGADEGSAVPAAQAKIFLFNKKEKSVNKKSLYQSEMIKLPAPPFCGILQREGEKTGGHNHKAVGCLFAEGRGTGAGTEGPVSEYQSGMQSGTDEKVQDTERIQ
ncbi:MAG TPA: hypothetical protein H9744_11910 [Candidatus Eisenbergiella stercoravium]|nr:hypothetical protein [Candidatus Eisenbergiella stercoravium]